MGWGSAGNIFDPVARRLLSAVDSKEVPEYVAVETLTLLARVLFDGDWDTPDESLDAARNHPTVVEALKQAGWEAEPDE